LLAKFKQLGKRFATAIANRQQISGDDVMHALLRGRGYVAGTRWHMTPRITPTVTAIAPIIN